MTRREGLFFLQRFVAGRAAAVEKKNFPVEALDRRAAESAAFGIFFYSRVTS